MSDEGSGPGVGMASTPHAPDFLKQAEQRVAHAQQPGGRAHRLSKKGLFSNSTNSLFIGDTPTAPDSKALLHAAAKALVALVVDMPEPGMYVHT